MAVTVSLSLPAEGATFQGEGGAGGGGLRLEEAIRRGRAGGRAPGEPKASLLLGSGSHARPRAATVCTQCALGLRLAPLQLTLHCSPSQKPRSRRGSGSSVSRSHCWLLRPRCAHGSRGAGNPGSPRSARPLRLGQDPPAAPAEPQPLSSASTSAYPSAGEAECVCVGGHPFSRGHHSLSPFSKNLFEEALREKDVLPKL